MLNRRAIATLALTALAVAGGCRSGKPAFLPADAAPVASGPQAGATTPAEGGVTPVQFTEPAAAPPRDAPATELPARSGANPQRLPEVEPSPNADPSDIGSALQEPIAPSEPAEVVAAEPTAAPLATPTPSVEDVVRSVVEFFPIIQLATAGRQIAYGQVLEASGAFDHKLDVTADSQPLDFYENHRSGVSVKRDTTWGGQTFAGYRVGRGVYEPWYLERETNKGGEFKVGFVAPIIRDRVIDANRSELWQAQVEQARVEALINLEVIAAARDGAVAYWEWLAAIEILRIAEDVLQLGIDRRDFIDIQVEEGDKARFNQTDNERIIVQRQAKVIDSRRKVRQTAAKLSLFLRDPAGRPVVLGTERPDAEFRQVGDINGLSDADIAFARNNRPEQRELQLLSQQLGIAISQANNETWPDVDAGLLFAQDVGERTSSKGDKSEFELEASFTLSVPLERRKAFGKLRQLRGKLAQLRAKQRFAENKITIEVQVAREALEAAAMRVERTTEGVRLANRILEDIRLAFEEGETELFELNIREKQAADAAVELVIAQFDYHVAAADYAAALGLSQPEIDDGRGITIPGLPTTPAEAL